MLTRVFFGQAWIDVAEQDRLDTNLAGLDFYQRFSNEAH